MAVRKPPTPPAGSRPPGDEDPDQPEPAGDSEEGEEEKDKDGKDPDKDDGPDPPDTEDLVKGFLRRDEEAERRLYQRVELLVPSLLRHSKQWRGHLSRRFEPDDVVSELWRRLLASRVLEKFEWRGQGSLNRELHKILDRLLADMSRRAMAEKRGGGRNPFSLDVADPEEPALPEPPARDPTPSFQARSREEHEWVRQQLEPPEQQIFDLWIQGLNGVEIASSLGSPLYQVRTVIRRIEALYRRNGRD